MVLKFEANLAKVLLGFVMLEGSDDFLQQKTAVDNGLQTIGRYRPNHVLLICSAANGDPADTNLIRKQCRDRRFSRKTSQDADEGDMPARPAGCDRLRQRAGSADLNHMIDTASARRILCLLAPVRHGLVINDGVGPETLELFQLLLGGRGSDYSGARSFRELQREERYATRAKDQHRITGLYLAAHHQASPGGDSRAGQRCRLHMRVACRCLGEGVRRHAHVLAGITVNTMSGYIPLGSGRDFAS